MRMCVAIAPPVPLIQTSLTTISMPASRAPVVPLRLGLAAPVARRVPQIHFLWEGPVLAACALPDMGLRSSHPPVGKYVRLAHTMERLAVCRALQEHTLLWLTSHPRCNALLALTITLWGSRIAPRVLPASGEPPWG